MKTSYYEYGIELKFYQARDRDPELDYYYRGDRHSRDSYISCLRKLGRQDLIDNRRKMIIKGTQFILWRPKGHVRAFMIMSPSAIVQDWGILRRFKWQWQDIYKRMVYGCLDRAMELNWRYIKLRTGVLDSNLNIYMEELVKELGCELFVSVKNY